jgi:RNA polymerase sigma factor (sigma-70 family)
MPIFRSLVSILRPSPRARPSDLGMGLLSTHSSTHPSTFEAIVRAHFRDVARCARWFGAPERETEDIAQLVFMALHRAIVEKRFTFGEDPRPWLRATTSRITRDHMQTLQRHGLPMELEGELEPMDGKADPERTAQVSRLEALVHELLEGLDYDCRVVFVLHEIEGLTLPEIAEEQGILPTTARWRLRAARNHFEAALRRRCAADKRKYGAGAVFLPLSADAILRLARALPPPDTSPEMEARVWARVQKEIGLSAPTHLRPGKPRELRPRTPQAPRPESLILAGLAFVVGVMAGTMGLDLLRRPATPPRPPREPAPILAVAPPVDDSFLATLPDTILDNATPSTRQVPPRAPSDPDGEAEMSCLQRASELLGRPREALGELARCEERFPQTHFPIQRDRLRRDAEAALSRTR